jgi:hypothetical protein
MTPTPGCGTHCGCVEPCCGGGCGGGGGCGCGCGGGAPLTPLPTANPPGLDALSYRAGTQATFLAAMKARLGSTDFPELQGLTTRDPADFSLALLDAWATVAGVLTFYQERIANEGYLRTATERRSVFELARLVGYVPRPGVAASTYLAFSLQDNPDPSTGVPAGARAQSVPGPGELPQSFETSAPLTARVAWNALQPRLTRPQLITPANVESLAGLWFQGANLALKANDPLLFVFGPGAGEQTLRRIAAAEPDAVRNRTRVTLQETPPELLVERIRRAVVEVVDRFLRVDDFGVTPESQMAVAVVATLTTLRAAMQGDEPAPALAAALDEARGELAADLAAMTGGRYSRLQPWVEAAQKDLDAVAKWIEGEMAAFHSGALGAASGSATAPAGGGSGGAGAVEGLGVLVRGKGGGAASSPLARLAGLLSPLALAPSRPPANAQRLQRSVGAAFAPSSDLLPRLLAQLRPELRTTLYQAWRNQPAALPARPVEVYVLRLAAPVFGHNAPLIPQLDANFKIVGYQEWVFARVARTALPQPAEATPAPAAPARRPAAPSPAFTRILFEPTEQQDVVCLDMLYKQVVPGGWVVMDRPADAAPVSTAAARRQIVSRTLAVWESSRAEYGLTGKSTHLQLSSPWLLLQKDLTDPAPLDTFPVLRGVTVYAQSELLPLAEAPLTRLELQDGTWTEAPLPVAGDRIELDSLLGGLESGRWLIVSGERADLPGTSGVLASELVMLAGVEQRTAQVEDPAAAPVTAMTPAGTPAATGGAPPPPPSIELPGDRPHTTLVLAAPLAYAYKRETVTLYGNVAHATHGETKSEVLGSGDAARALQQFTLKQPPLTWVPAPTPSGVASTLEVRVNDVLWHEAGGLAGLAPTDRDYVTRTDDQGQVTVTFGDGRQGARLPSGVENVRARYRSGIGAGGNVRAGQISVLATRPLHVKSVVNPLPATGGADPESRDQARANAPLAVEALDRLVAVRDYADFARTFAGIGKASAGRFSDGRRQLVHVTVAGLDDIPLAPSSDLVRNLEAALRLYGDPHLPVAVALADRSAVVLSARVRVLPDYLWEAVEPVVRAALADRFGFVRRDLAADLFLSQVVSAIQQVRGVDFVVVEVLDQVSATSTPDDLAKLAARLGSGQPKPRLAAAPARVVIGDAGLRQILPAQLVYLDPNLPDTLILKELAP